MSADTHAGPARAPAHLAGGKPATDADFILERRRRLVAPYLHAHDRLLDFGCGSGTQTVTFLDAVRVVLGVDVDASFLRACAQRLARAGDGANAAASRYDGRVLGVRSGSIDTVVSFEVLEHVEDEQQALAEIHRVLVPGGRLCLTVPNRWWIFETHGADLPWLPWNRVPFFSWLPKRIHDRWARARIYRRREIVGLLRAHGFEVERSAYVTAPMDVARPSVLKHLLRRTIFRPDTTPVPGFATAVLVIARKPADL